MAGIWVAAGIGISIAAGLYAVGIAATVLSLIGLEVLGLICRDRRNAIAAGDDVGQACAEREAPNP